MKRLGLSVAEPPPKAWSAGRTPPRSAELPVVLHRWRADVLVHARMGAEQPGGQVPQALRHGHRGLGVVLAPPLVVLVQTGRDGVELPLPVVLVELPPAAAEFQQHLGGRVVVRLDDGAALLVREGRGRCDVSAARRRDGDDRRSAVQVCTLRTGRPRARSGIGDGGAARPGEPAVVAVAARVRSTPAGPSAGPSRSVPPQISWRAPREAIRLPPSISQYVAVGVDVAAAQEAVEEREVQP